MKLSELAEKEVVNIKNGEFIGYITDLEIDSCTGKIYSIYVLQSNDFLTLKPCNTIKIPWSSVCKIGKDTILVDFCAEK